MRHTISSALFGTALLVSVTAATAGDPVTLRSAGAGAPESVMTPIAAPVDPPGESPVEAPPPPA